MRPNVANQLAADAVTQAVQTIERRVNELGVAEPIVTRYSGANQILVQLPGVDDPERARALISTTAQLEFRLVEQGPYSTREEAVKAVGGTVPAESEIMPGRGIPTPRRKRFLRREEVVGGDRCGPPQRVARARSQSPRR